MFVRTFSSDSIVDRSRGAVLALFVLRSREPNMRRPFKALGYPVVPAIFTVASFLIVANAIYGDPKVSGAGIGIILAGLPVYLLFARRHGLKSVKFEL